MDPMGYPFSPPKKVAQNARFRYASGEQRRRFNAGANDSPVCTRRNFILQAVEQAPTKNGTTPLKINALNPKITQLKRNIWTKPPWLWVPMLIFRGVVPDTAPVSMGENPFGKRCYHRKPGGHIPVTSHKLRFTTVNAADGKVPNIFSLKWWWKMVIYPG